MIMLYVFVGALVLGGILLGASILVGDGHGDVDDITDLHVHVDAEGIDVIVGAFRSIRFWTFFTTFFGLTGVALSGLQLIDSSILTTLVAVGMGVFAGYAAVLAFRTMDRKESNSMAAEGDFVGKTGRLLVGVAPGNLGKIRVQVKGATVDLLAKSDDETIGVGDEAIIIEMDGTIARVAIVDSGEIPSPRGE